MLDLIQRLQAELSPAERRVADRVLAHPRDTLSSTLATLALKAGTSEPTVIRFCRRLGVSGFSQFKLRLAEYLSRPGAYLHQDVGPDDGISDAVMKVMDRSIQAIVNVRELSQSMPFQTAVDHMSGARQWVFAGLGASGNVARDACNKFFRLGVPCAHQTDSPSIRQAAALLDHDDVLLIISHSGRWQDIAEAQQSARDNGAFVIALTQPGSPVAEQASLLFHCIVGEDTGIYTPMSSRLAHLAILDALQVSLALHLGAAADRNLRRSKAAISDI